MQRNARFWVYLNDGWIKMSMRPGLCLTHYSKWAHDEGWSSEHNAWTCDGQGVTHEWISDGRDCDGGLTRHGVSYCPIDNLRDSDMFSHEIWGENPPAENHGIRTPAWEDVKRSQRDEYAEMAGY